MILSIREKAIFESKLFGLEAQKLRFNTDLTGFNCTKHFRFPPPISRLKMVETTDYAN